MKALLLVTAFLSLLSLPKLSAQDPLDGLWQGYDGEWRHVSNQLVALAEATPADKFAWRPAPGVRSTSEVYMHIVMANFYLLSVTGPKMPPDLKMNAEKTITSKPKSSPGSSAPLKPSSRRTSRPTPKTCPEKLRSPGAMQPSKACISVSSCTTMNTWASSSLTPA